MFLLLIINIISFRLFFSRQMVLLPFRVFELVDLDAHGDGLVAGDAARGARISAQPSTSA